MPNFVNDGTTGLPVDQNTPAGEAGTALELRNTILNAHLKGTGNKHSANAILGIEGTTKAGTATPVTNPDGFAVNHNIFMNEDGFEAPAINVDSNQPLSVYADTTTFNGAIVVGGVGATNSHHLSFVDGAETHTGNIGYTVNGLYIEDLSREKVGIYFNDQNVVFSTSGIDLNGFSLGATVYSDNALTVVADGGTLTLTGQDSGVVIGSDFIANGPTFEVDASSISFGATSLPTGPGFVNVGSMVVYGKTTVPATGNWLLANGAAISRTTYAALFAVIGTVFGVGNGTTTFNVPTCVAPAVGSAWLIRAS